MIVVWTETALDHIASIKQYISLTSHIYAEQVVGRLLDRGRQLEAFPESGREVPEVGQPDVREVVEPPYRVIYRLKGNHIEIVAVVHSRRGELGVTG